jgi:hypothetical protein
MIQSFAAILVPADERRPYVLRQINPEHSYTINNVCCLECVSPTSEGPQPYASVRFSTQKKP